MNGFLIGFDTKMPAHTYRILPIDVDDVVLNRLTHFFSDRTAKVDTYGEEEQDQRYRVHNLQFR